MGHGGGKGEVRRETDQPVGEDDEFLALVDGRVWEGAFWCRFCRRHEDVYGDAFSSLRERTRNELAVVVRRCKAIQTLSNLRVGARSMRVGCDDARISFI